MLQWMRRNNKKLLAVFTVGLMIAFAFTPQSGQSQRDAAMTIGEVNGRRIMVQDVAYPANLWNYTLNSIFLLAANNPTPVPLALLLSGDPQTGEQLARQLNDNNAMLYLLVDEANRMGITVSQNEIDELGRNIAVRVDDGKGPRLLDFATLAGTEHGDRAQQALYQFLLIQKSFFRAASVVKISQPILDQEKALSMQSVKLSAIEFPASAFAAQVPNPTTQQLEQHFNLYAEQLPQVDPTRNPTGYGYRYPDRIKLQYVEVPADEVREVVRRSKTDYDWEVEAQKYYRRNLSQFPTTQPTTQAAKPFDLSAPATQPATQPTTRPFAEVKDQIVAQLIAPEVDKLKDQITNRILSTIGGDYMSYSATLKNATTQRTSLNAPYDSFDYLSALRNEIQRQFKVNVVVQQLANEFYTYEDLQAQGTIGKAFLITGNQQNPVLDFPQYAMAFCEKFQPAGERRREGVISMMASSRPVTDGAGNIYVFRITEADPSHKPASVQEVLDKATADWKADAALALARDAAVKALEIAKTQGMSAAAASLNKPLIQTGWIDGRMNWRDPNLPLSSDSIRTFGQQVVEMLATAKLAPEKPVFGIMQLPRDYKVLLAHLENTRPTGSEDQLQVAALMTANQLQSQMTMRLPQEWFAWENIKARTQFIDRNEISSRATQPAD